MSDNCMRYIFTESEMVEFKKKLPSALETITINTNPLALAGALIQYGASLIPVYGGVVSTLIGVFWPQNEADVWDTIVEKVKSLIGDEIDAEEYTILKDKINEIKGKIETYSTQLASGQYSLALNTFNALITYFDSIEDNFKLNGHNFAQSFTPIFTTVITLKISFYIDSYIAKDNMGLTADQVEEIESMLSSTVKNAKDYLSTLESNVVSHDYAVNDRNNEIEFCNYYYSNVISHANYMWKEDIMDYVNGFTVDGCKIPVAAIGTWINNPYPDLDNPSFAKLIQCGCNTEQDYCDDEGYIEAPPLTPLSGATKLVSISVFNDEALDQRCTGISYTVNGDNSSQEDIELGKTDKTLFDPDYKVTGNSANFESCHICTISVWAGAFVSYIGFYSIEGTSVAGGQYSSRDTQYQVTIPQPFNLCTISGTSDIGSYNYGTGHQCAAVGLGAIYDNGLAQEMVKQVSIMLFSNK